MQCWECWEWGLIHRYSVRFEIVIVLRHMSSVHAKEKICINHSLSFLDLTFARPLDLLHDPPISCLYSYQLSGARDNIDRPSRGITSSKRVITISARMNIALMNLVVVSHATSKTRVLTERKCRDASAWRPNTLTHPSTSHLTCVCLVFGLGWTGLLPWHNLWCLSNVCCVLNFLEHASHL